LTALSEFFELSMAINIFLGIFDLLFWYVFLKNGFKNGHATVLHIYIIYGRMNTTRPANDALPAKKSKGRARKRE